MATLRVRALGALGATVIALATSCQLVAGIEPWSAGSGGASASSGTQGPITGSASSGCSCSPALCFGGECSCDAQSNVVCKPRDIPLVFQSKCVAGARHCIAAAPDHVMLIEKGDEENDLVVLVPKELPADGGAVLVTPGLRDVAWNNGKGYALGDAGVYSGNLTAWSQAPAVVVGQGGTPAFLRKLRLGGAELLTYVDDSASALTGLWLLDGTQPLKKLPSTFVGADADGTRGFAVIASAPPIVNVFDPTFAVTDNLEVPGQPALDLAAGGGHLFVLLIDGTVMAKDVSGKSEFGVAPVTSRFESKKIVWTPKHVYASDMTSQIYRFSSTPPYAVDDAFLVETPLIKDFAVDEEGVYWVDAGKQLHLLAVKND